MSDIITNDRQLDKYCEDLAKQILAELAEYGGDMDDLIHETVDSSEHVIYHRKAHAICQHCNIDDGEEFVSETGEPEDGWSYDGFAVALAYGEMLARVRQYCEALENEQEEAA